MRLAGIYKIEPTYVCCFCEKTYKEKNKNQAENCFQKHLLVFKRLCPKYKVGIRVETRNPNEHSYSEEITTIIKIRKMGVPDMLELLVEDDQGGRYWVGAFTFQSRDPEKTFRFVKIVS